MPKAIIKTYKKDREFGFLKVEGETTDVYFRKSDLLKLGFSEAQIQDGLELEVNLYEIDGKKRVSTRPQPNNQNQGNRRFNEPTTAKEMKVSVRTLKQPSINENFALKLNKDRQSPLFDAKGFEFFSKLDRKSVV